MNTADRLRELLLQEWSSGLRLTTIPQAMQRLAVHDDLRLRWRVAEGLEGLWPSVLTSPEKSRAIAKALGRSFDESQVEQFRRQVGTWNFASVLLSEDEKLVARYILMHKREGRGLPQPSATISALGLPTKEVFKAFRVLGHLGFLSFPAGRNVAGYALADGYGNLLEGLGFSFHTVSLETGESFGVPCAVDFLLLVSSQYQEHRVTLEDACAHCVDRAHIEVDRGKLVRVDPEDTIVYQGGT